MAHRWIVSTLLIALIGSVPAPARPADALVLKTRIVDPARLKAQELEKQRLLAKLRSEAPKLVEQHSGRDPLEAPLFHRYDRAWR